jgi:hypothetical protein
VIQESVTVFLRKKYNRTTSKKGRKSENKPEFERFVSSRNRRWIIRQGNSIRPNSFEKIARVKKRILNISINGFPCSPYFKKAYRHPSEKSITSKLFLEDIHDTTSVFMG